jgi:peptidoglycan hydrolase-like protein with peptidoglycan-binding domain
MSQSVFDKKAPVYMTALLKNFPQLAVLDTAAVFGNLGHESGGLENLQEDRPTVKGSKGGYGWAQWTGPRRRAFEAWCRTKKLNPASDDANYGFLVHELLTTHASSITALLRARTLESKTVAFEKSFEGAGIKHYPERKKWALRALHAYEAVYGPIATPLTPPPRPANIVSPVPIALPESPAAKPTGGVSGFFKRLWGHAPLSQAPTPPVASLPAEDMLVRRVQKQLARLGYNEVGIIDGRYGNNTKTAISRFRAEQAPKLQDDEVSDALLAALMKGSQRTVSPERANATGATLREGGSKTVQNFDAIGFFAKMMLGVAGVGGVDQTGILDTVKNAATTAQETAQTATTVLQSLATFITGVVGAVQWCLHHWWLFAAFGAFYVLWKVGNGILDVIIKFRTGILQRPSV